MQAKQRIFRRDPSATLSAAPSIIIAILAAATGWLPLTSGHAAPPAANAPFPQVTSVRSQSGQFIINATEAKTAPSASGPFARTNSGLVQLDLPLLSVSCERIKQILYRELGAANAWRGKIYLVMHRPDDGLVRILADRFRDGWQYRVSLPREIESSRLVRAMVQVLLLEMANRTAGQRSAELPPWLVDGLTEQLLASNELEIILPPPPSNLEQVRLSTTNQKRRRENPLAVAHEVLSTAVPLTFEQLSWPAEYGAETKAERVYRASAQLFVSELMRLKDGKAALREMLGQLPRHLNWQFAFLRGFQHTFASVLETEKWWALRVLTFTGRDLAQVWAFEQGWEKLSALVHASVQVRVSTNELPLHTQVPLQRIIREWQHDQQGPMLQQKIQDLKLMRQRVPDELVDLVDGYRLALETYLSEIDKKRIPFLKPAARERAVKQALTRLEQLDDDLLRIRIDGATQKSPAQAKK